MVICLSLGKLKPEEKVNLAINMTDVCVSVCVEDVKHEHSTINEEELMELVRERMSFGKKREHGV